MNARAFKYSLVCPYASLFMTRVESQCLGHLSSVQKYRVCTDNEILESLEVCIDGSEKVVVIYHSEQKSFG